MLCFNIINSNQTAWDFQVFHKVIAAAQPMITICDDKSFMIPTDQKNWRKLLVVLYFFKIFFYMDVVFRKQRQTAGPENVL